MSKTAIADALVAELAKLPPGRAGDRAALRAAIGCSAADLRQAIDRLRYSGKIEFDRIELRASMRDDPVHVEQGAVGTDESLPEEPDAGADAKGQERSDPAGAGLTASGPDDLTRGRAAVARQPHKLEVAGSIPAPVTDPGADPGLVADAPRPPTGAEIAAEIAAYCARVGAAHSRFGVAAGFSVGLVAGIAASKRPRAATVARVRAFIADHPDGFPGMAVDEAKARGGRMGGRARHLKVPLARGASPAPPVATPPAERIAGLDSPLASSGAREAVPGTAALFRPPARPRARIPLPAGLTTVEAVQSALAETPHDLIVALERRHGELWRRCILTGRAAGETPAAILYAALARGLDAIAIPLGEISDAA